MTFEQLIKIEDDTQKMNALRNFNDINNLTPYQKMLLVSSINSDEFVVELLSNDLIFSRDIFVHTIRGVFSNDMKDKIATEDQYAWLRNKVAQSNLTRSNIVGIIDSYEGDKKALNFLDKTKPYYKANENIILRNTTFSYDESIINNIMNIEKVGVAERENIKKALKKLYNVNKEILETVNLKILTSKYARLGEKLTVITVYPEIQEKILELGRKELNFFCTAIDYFNSLHMDWIPLADDLLDNIKQYSKIINNDLSFSSFVKSIPKDGTPSDNVMKILTIMTEKNKYKYKSLREMMNAQRGERINNVIDEEFFKLAEGDKYRALIFEKVFGHDFETSTRFYEYYAQDYEKTIQETYKSDSDISDYLTRVRKLNPSSQEFKNELQYIKESNQMIRQYLEISKKIFECDNIQDLKKMYESYSKMKEINIPKAILDTNFRRFFSRLKLEKLYMPKESDKINVNGEDAYLMPPGAYWQLTSLDSYAVIYSDRKHVKDWNEKIIQNHIICTVFGNSKNMSHAPIFGASYGFAGYDERALIKAAPYDLGTWNFSRKFEAYKSDSAFRAKFCTPETQVNETLSRHGEDALERKSYNYESDKIFKLQPTYTISFVEPELKSYFKREIGSSEILTTEVLKNIVDNTKMNDMAYRQNVISNELKNDPKWSKSVDEAKQKGIPKTIIDRTHDLIIERLKMDEKETELLKYTNSSLNDPNNMQRFLQLVEEIIVDFDAARAGNSQREVLGVFDNGGTINGDVIHKEIYNKLFSSKVMDDKLSKLENKFSSLDAEKYKICMEKMKEVSRKQVNKLDKYAWWFEHDTSHDWNDYYKYAARTLSGITYQNERAVIQSLLDSNVNGMSMTGGQAVKKTIKEIEQLREYDIEDGNPDWHGRRHINNVALFSFLIAQKEGKIGDNMDLVLQAAKYHDVGRDGVWNGLGAGKRHDGDLVPHAYPGALASEFYMKKELNPDGSRKYTDAQIAMVKVAIAYHEVNEKNRNQFDTDTFNLLCQREKVRPEDFETTKLMCIYLKDADALDRTRFLYEDENVMFYKQYSDNLDMRYLRTDTAIALRDFSRSINDIHYGNKTDRLYIPKELDKYSVKDVTNLAPDWNQTKAEIRQFLSTRDIKGDLPTFFKNDIQSMIKNPKDKNIFFRIRNKFKDFIKKVKERFSELLEEKEV